MAIEGAGGVRRSHEVGAASIERVRGQDLASRGTDRIEAARAALGAGGRVTAQVQSDRAAPSGIGAAGGVQPRVELARTDVVPPPPSRLELAAMAQAAYGITAPPQGWSVASNQQLAAIGLTPAMLRSPTSEFRAEVFVREFGGQTSYTVAFRGSTAAQSDWVSNGRQAVGLETDHYNRALEIGESLIVPQGSRVSITGHSLGGGLASAAAIAAEIDATTFNAAGLHANTIGRAQAIAGADGRIDAPDIAAVYVRGDILSLLQDGGDQMIGSFVGRGLGSWLGGPVGGAVGGIAGGQLVDAPEAYGTRIPLDPVRPAGVAWYQDTPGARHGMDYVISSLRGN